MFHIQLYRPTDLYKNNPIFVLKFLLTSKIDKILKSITSIESAKTVISYDLRQLFYLIKYKVNEMLFNQLK